MSECLSFAANGRFAVRWHRDVCRERVKNVVDYKNGLNYALSREFSDTAVARSNGGESTTWPPHTTNFKTTVFT